MLIEFKVANHRSLHAEQSLNFVTGLSTTRGREIPEAGSPVLPVMVIHGANASGKSNVVSAIEWFARAVLDSHRAWSPDGGVPTKPFAFGPGPSQPSVYEVDFVAAHSRWTYGAEVDSKRVIREWLHQYTQTHRRRILFERKAQEFSFGGTFAGQNQAIAKLTRPNSLFLSTAAQSGHAGILPAWRWFARTCFAGPDDLFARQRYTTDTLLKPADRSAVLHAMRAADFGLVDLNVVETEISDETRRFLDLLLRESKAEAQAPPSKQREVQFQHQAGNDSAYLDFASESHGTRAWFGLVGPLIHVLRTGSLLCFDELDHHLHPLLVEQVVQAFQDPEVNRKGAQLLYTTQRTFDFRPSSSGESDEPILDRDQIWLTEKDASGETRLFPLSDYKPRRRQNLERAYLQGRFGAVPYADIRSALLDAVSVSDGGHKKTRTR